MLRSTPLVHDSSRISCSVRVEVENLRYSKVTQLENGPFALALFFISRSLHQNIGELDVSVHDARIVNRAQGLQDHLAVVLDLVLILDFSIFNLEPVFEILWVIALFHKQNNVRFCLRVVIQLYYAIILENGVDRTFFLCLGELKVTEQLGLVNRLSDQFLKNENNM